MVKLGTNVVEDFFVALIVLSSLEGTVNKYLTFEFSAGTLEGALSILCRVAICFTLENPLQFSWLF